MTEIVLIAGDGIGPEIVQAAQKCIEATAADVCFTEAVMGAAAIDRYGTPLPDETLDAVKEAGVALKGPVTTPVGTGFRSVNVALRKQLDLYANVRPAAFMPGSPSRITDPGEIDLVVVRENLEDLYTGIEFAAGSDAEQFEAFLTEHGHKPPQGAGFSVKPISRHGAERVIRYAFDYAVAHGREKVTVVDKANIMKETDGLFMQVGEAVSQEYDVTYEHVLVDNMAQQLVLRPEEFDVIVTQNIYGDILSDLTAGLVGGIGLAPSANIGDDTAVFEPVHGTAPDIAGEGVANPVAGIRSAALLLRHIGEEDAAAQIEEAVRTVVSKGGAVTPDLGGAASTTEMQEAVLQQITE